MNIWTKTCFTPDSCIIIYLSTNKFHKKATFWAKIWQNATTKTQRLHPDRIQKDHQNRLG